MLIQLQFSSLHHLISSCNANFHWLKDALPGKVVSASPYPEVHSDVISNANIEVKI